MDFRREYRIDLVEYFRGDRPWWEFGVFLDALPTASRYIEAKRNDPEYARRAAAMLADEDTPRKWSPRAAEWTTQHELMASFFDRLGDWLVQHANSNREKGKPAIKPLPRFPRPVTAIDRERAAIEARVETQLDDLIEAAYAEYEREHGEVTE